MKFVTGSMIASTSWNVPMRMPSGTARTDASAKPTKTTKHEAAMWVQREPSLHEVDGGQRHLVRRRQELRADEAAPREQHPPAEDRARR